MDQNDYSITLYLFVKRKKTEKVIVQLQVDLDRGVKPAPGGTVFKTLECGYLTGADYEAEGGSRGFVYDSSPECLQKRCRSKLFPTAVPTLFLLLFSRVSEPIQKKSVYSGPGGVGVAHLSGQAAVRVFREGISC